MEVFINERSLNNQYSDIYSFSQAINAFISAIDFIATVKVEKKTFRSTCFYDYTGLSKTHLGTILKSNNDLNRRFLDNLQRLNPKKWEQEQQQDLSATYIFNGIDYVGSSVAEIAERKAKVACMKGFLLNFNDSQFSDCIKFDILKNAIHIIPISCAYDIDSIHNWLIDYGIINLNETYDESSRLCPADKQTVLKNESIFELTTYKKNKGRKVYRRKNTDQLWVVDSKHAGKGAHIEVFSKITRKHLGTSLYNVVMLDPKHKAKDNREIDLG